MGNQNSFLHLKPGDLIEICQCLYKHWAIYVGDGDVIHLTTDGGSGVELNFGLPSSIKFAEVRREPLFKVAGNDPYCVNNSSDNEWNPLPVDQIMQNAEKWVGKQVLYNPAAANLEHFVKMLRYNTAKSRQVKKTLAVPALVAIIFAIVFTIAFAVVIVVVDAVSVAAAPVAIPAPVLSILAVVAATAIAAVAVAVAVAGTIAAALIAVSALIAAAPVPALFLIAAFGLLGLWNFFPTWKQWLMRNNVF
ncbi:phospholipase A and acyltransferase 3-like [Heterodontus francisci]|uniref:phospholipase A and acyltransferase 3-like n=1 Tax=Heterodontus francisci TaxID=7792 RepID=UPI00355C613E